jgi:glucose-1-phosphate cytidylyltransferase|tara:strand:+ start:8315 stop:9100 length:786 start_codon:yes stop_codon:yes gene_type:complete
MTNRCAVVLCGGKGSRLGLLGKKIPKTLVKVQGKEILWYIIQFLKLSGFNNIILPLGYRGAQIKKFLKKNDNFGIKIKTFNTGINSNIGSRIEKIANYIQEPNFLLLNGDAIFDFNLGKIVNHHCKKKYAVTFLSGEVTYQYGSIGMRKNKVIDFSRNLVFDKLSTKGNKNYIAYNYTGISVINTQILKKYKSSFKKSDNFEQTFYPKIIKKFLTKLIQINGFWHSIDNLKDLLIVDKKQKKDDKYFKLKKLKNLLNKNRI